MPYDNPGDDTLYDANIDPNPISPGPRPDSHNNLQTPIVESDSSLYLTARGSYLHIEPNSLLDESRQYSPLKPGYTTSHADLEPDIAIPDNISLIQHFNRIPRSGFWLCNRHWQLGAEELIFPMFCAVFFDFLYACAGFATIGFLYALKDSLTTGCSAWTYQLMHIISWFHISQFLALHVINIGLICIGCKARTFTKSQGKKTRLFFFARILAAIYSVTVTILCTILALNVGQDQCMHSPRLPDFALIFVCLWIMVGFAWFNNLTTALFFMCISCFSRSKYSTDEYQTSWRKGLSTICCCFSSNNDIVGVYNSLARLLSEYISLDSSTASLSLDDVKMLLQSKDISNTCNDMSSIVHHNTLSPNVVPRHTQTPELLSSLDSEHIDKEQILQALSRYMSHIVSNDVLLSDTKSNKLNVVHGALDNITSLNRTPTGTTLTPTNTSSPTSSLTTPHSDDSSYIPDRLLSQRQQQSTSSRTTSPYPHPPQHTTSDTTRGTSDTTHQTIINSTTSIASSPHGSAASGTTHTSYRPKGRRIKTIRAPRRVRHKEREITRDSFITISDIAYGMVLVQAYQKLRLARGHQMYIADTVDRWDNDHDSTPLDMEGLYSSNSDDNQSIEDYNRPSRLPLPQIKLVGNVSSRNVSPPMSSSSLPRGNSGICYDDGIYMCDYKGNLTHHHQHHDNASPQPSSVTTPPPRSDTPQNVGGYYNNQIFHDDTEHTNNNDTTTPTNRSSHQPPYSTQTSRQQLDDNDSLLIDIAHADNDGPMSPQHQQQRQRKKIAVTDSGGASGDAHHHHQPHNHTLPHSIYDDGESILTSSLYSDCRQRNKVVNKKNKVTPLSKHDDKHNKDTVQVKKITRVQGLPVQRLSKFDDDDDDDEADNNNTTDDDDDDDDDDRHEYILESIDEDNNDAFHNITCIDDYDTSTPSTNTNKNKTTELTWNQGSHNKSLGHKTIESAPLHSPDSCIDPLHPKNHTHTTTRHGPTATATATTKESTNITTTAPDGDGTIIVPKHNKDGTMRTTVISPGTPHQSTYIPVSRRWWEHKDPPCDSIVTADTLLARGHDQSLVLDVMQGKQPDLDPRDWELVAIAKYYAPYAQGIYGWPLHIWNFLLTAICCCHVLSCSFGRPDSFCRAGHIQLPPKLFRRSGICQSLCCNSSIKVFSLLTGRYNSLYSYQSYFVDAREEYMRQHGISDTRYIVPRTMQQQQRPSLGHPRETDPLTPRTSRQATAAVATPTITAHVTTSTSASNSTPIPHQSALYASMHIASPPTPQYGSIMMEDVSTNKTNTTTTMSLRPRSPCVDDVYVGLIKDVPQHQQQQIYTPSPSLLHSDIFPSQHGQQQPPRTLSSYDGIIPSPLPPLGSPDDTGLVLLCGNLGTEYSQVCYIVAYDCKTRKIIISIRGTMSISDCITDVDTELSYLPFAPKYYGHKGMVASTAWLMQQLNGQCGFNLHDFIEQYQHLYHFTGIVITGHSLGAGVATILTAMLLQRYRNVLAIAFAPPPSLSPDLCWLLRNNVVSITYKNDMISRLSMLSLYKLRQQMLYTFRLCIDNKYDVYRYIINKQYHNVFITSDQCTIRDNMMYKHLLLKLSQYIQNNLPQQQSGEAGQLTLSTPRPPVVTPTTTTTTATTDSNNNTIKQQKQQQSSPSSSHTYNEHTIININDIDEEKYQQMPSRNNNKMNPQLHNTSTTLDISSPIERGSSSSSSPVPGTKTITTTTTTTTTSASPTPNETTNKPSSDKNINKDGLPILELVPNPIGAVHDPLPLSIAGRIYNFFPRNEIPLVGVDMNAMRADMGGYKTIDTSTIVGQDGNIVTTTTSKIATKSPLEDTLDPATLKRTIISGSQCITLPTQHYKRSFWNSILCGCREDKQEIYNNEYLVYPAHPTMYTSLIVTTSMFSDHMPIRTTLEKAPLPAGFDPTSLAKEY